MALGRRGALRSCWPREFFFLALGRRRCRSRSSPRRYAPHTARDHVTGSRSVKIAAFVRFAGLQQTEGWTPQDYTDSGIDQGYEPLCFGPAYLGPQVATGISPDKISLVEGS